MCILTLIYYLFLEVALRIGLEKELGIEVRTYVCIIVCLSCLHVSKYVVMFVGSIIRYTVLSQW